MRGIEEYEGAADSVICAVCTFAAVNLLESLLSAYAHAPRMDELLSRLSGKERVRLSLHGASGSLRTLIMAALYRREGRPMLYLAQDKEEAAYLENELNSLLPDKPALWFPDSFKQPLRFEKLDRQNVLLRSRAVERISGKKSAAFMVITYPEALMERVVSPRAMQKSRIEISTGEPLDLDFVLEVLLEYGFSREDFVYEPGQFSIRGGILDLFSYGHEYPYRIELFGEEVESIRTFNPLDQLSLKSVEYLSIIPNLNTRFKDARKVSFLDILPADTLVWMSRPEDALFRWEQAFAEAVSFAQALSGKREEEGEEELREFFNDERFVRPDELIEGVEKFSILSTSACLPPGMANADMTEVDWPSRPQPSFNRNFSLLIDHLHELEADGYRIYLFAENPRQIERFYAIFEDLGASFREFHPVVGSLHEGFEDPDLKIACFTDHQIFARFHRYKLKRGFSKEQALNLKMLRELKPGDYVTHIDHGVGVYSGLQKLEVNGQVQECVRLIYRNNDLLYVGINSLHKISKYVGKEGTAPAIHRLGSDSWKKLKSRTRKKVKDIARELIRLYAMRKAAEGHAFPPDDYLQVELEASFIYEDTPDQYKATQEVKEDMQKPYPMDRLICGDVGFGKTEIAIRAAFKAVADGKQVAVLVPTTILALQHFKTFAERLKEFDLRIDYLNRFRTAAEKREIFAKLKAGEIDIIIGTHALLNKETGFKDLGLLVIDEEQKFGVAAKEKLRRLKVNVDTLTLTATPIPRTLQFSLMAARDLSVLRTAPPNRQPIHTEVRVFNQDLIREAVEYEVDRGGQVFFVHNRVKNLPEITAMLQRICPEVRVAMAHGQMDSKALERTMLDFIAGEYDVLVSTNIIETGLDIPNANTIIINNAHQFGLSDLHQLRGRVGRSNRRAFCYLFCPPVSTLTPEARKRLKIIEEFSELGSGLNIAMRDLDIRGAGNMLGAEQSGFIADIGYETYQKILEEAIRELKEKEFKELFREELEKEQQYVRDVQIETDAEMHIPDDYVESINERLSLYKELNELEDEEGIKAFAEKLKDRFGPVPAPVFQLFYALRLRWMARKMGFERISLQNGKLICFFISDAQSPYYESAFFKKFFDFLAREGFRHQLRLKQTSKNFMLIREAVDGPAKAVQLLEKVYGEVV